MAAAPVTRPYRVRVALVVLFVSQFVISADVTVANVALPVIRRELGFDDAGLSWVINGYLVAVTGVVLVAGRLADAFGSRRMFLLGVGLLTATSVVCGLATTPAVLVGARFGQGIGAAIATSAGMALLIRTVTGEHARTRALAILAAGGILGSSVGLVAGAALTEWVSWRWVFLSKLPIGVTIALAALLIPVPVSPTVDRRVDLLSALLLSSGLGVFVYAVVSVKDAGLASPVSLSLSAAGVLLLGVFILRQRWSARPLLPLRLLRSRRLLCGSFVLVVTTGSMLGQFFLQAQFVQTIGGFDSWQTGLAFLPVNVTIAACSLLLARWVVARIGAARVLPLAGVVLVVGLLLYVRQGDDFRYVTDMLPSLLALGVGAGLLTVTAMVVAVSDAAPEESGLVSGFVQMSQQMGGALGVAVLATVSSAVGSGGGSDPASEIAGYRAAFIVAACVMVLGVVVSLLIRTREGEVRAS